MPVELLFSQLVSLLAAAWWPFCRIFAAFAMAPMLGDPVVPMPLRALLSLVLTVVLFPIAQVPVAISPWSLQGILATVEQAAIGAAIGLAFHLVVSAVMLLGYLVSSQMALAMAIMNDPLNGTSSDVVSVILYLLTILLFFSIDGHLVLVTVLGASFKAWPVGVGIGALSLQSLALNVAWIFSAAMLMALPIIFSTVVVQLGFGFLNRIAPALNLFSLGFSLVLIFGVFMLGQIVRTLPEHYLQMTNRMLEMLQQNMHAVPHG